MLKTRNANKVYTVKFVNEKRGINTTIKVRGNEYILDAAQAQGINLPISCCAGACTTCTAKIQKGEVDQDHFFLKPKELEAGFVLPCKAYAASDCTLITHQEDALLNL